MDSETVLWCKNTSWRDEIQKVGLLHSFVCGTLALLRLGKAIAPWETEEEESRGNLEEQEIEIRHESARF
jgi:hypothetical protein